MSQKHGCLLVHGFGGSVKEVKPLADKLAKEGYIVNCPSLKGHTGNQKDLKGINYRDWIGSAREGMVTLAKKCDKVTIIGFSMGGLIALQLAREFKLESVITMNSPVYYWDLKRIIINIVNDIRQKSFDNIARYINSARKFPLDALINFRLLLLRTKNVMGDIKCPIFVIQALEDDTVRKTSANYIYDHIGSVYKDLKFYSRSGHLILWSEAAEEVMQDVKSFLKKVCKLNQIY